MSTEGQQAGGSTTNVAVVAAGFSTLYALYLFLFKGQRQLGIFVGLWAPTILGLANHMEHTEIPEEIEEQAT